MSNLSQIRSRERVRQLAEVYTAKREVHAMLDLVKHECARPDSRFLEPSCGSGNFCVEILARKLRAVAKKCKTQPTFEFYTLVSVCSVYGVDICEENVVTTRDRLFIAAHDHYFEQKRNTWKEPPGYFDALRRVITKNIVQGDFINGAGHIALSEWATPAMGRFKERVYALSDLGDPDARPIAEARIVSYRGLANA